MPLTKALPAGATEVTAIVLAGATLSSASVSSWPMLTAATPPVAAFVPVVPVAVVTAVASSEVARLAWVPFVDAASHRSVKVGRPAGAVQKAAVPFADPNAPTRKLPIVAFVTAGAVTAVPDAFGCPLFASIGAASSTPKKAEMPPAACREDVVPQPATVPKVNT